MGVLTEKMLMDAIKRVRDNRGSAIDTFWASSRMAEALQNRVVGFAWCEFERQERDSVQSQ